MADLAFRNQEIAYPENRTAWGAIWIGLFSFITIWSVFGMLGEAIFASNANPHAAAPVAGQNWGMAAWIIVLTTVAMYVAGRITGHASGAVDRNDRIIHGIGMFGLSVISVVLIVVMSGYAMSGGSGVAGSTHSPYMLTVFADIGWVGFVALILGWFAAMGGAAHAPTVNVPARSAKEFRNVQNPAA